MMELFVNLLQQSVVFKLFMHLLHKSFVFDNDGIVYEFVTREFCLWNVYAIVLSLLLR
jgi:hypothetical protein